MIDTHLHLWDPRTIPRSWLRDAPSLDRRFDLAAYGREASSLGIDAAIHIETDVDEGGFERELEEIDAIRVDGSLVRAMVVGGRPGHPGFPGWAEAAASRPGVVGIRRVFHGCAVGACWSTESLAGDLRLLGEHDLLFELCVRPDQLDAASRLVEDCPNTTFVLDHLGRPEIRKGVTPGWLEGIRRMAGLENVVVKLSGLIECAGGGDWSAADFRPFFEAVLDRFEADRIVWGSNWPVCTLGGSIEGWVETTKAMLADHPRHVREAVLEGNARRIYRLD